MNSPLVSVDLVGGGTFSIRQDLVEETIAELLRDGAVTRHSCVALVAIDYRAKLFAAMVPPTWSRQ